MKNKTNFRSLQDLFNIAIILMMVFSQFGWAVGNAVAEESSLLNSGISGTIYEENSDIPIQNALVTIRVLSPNDTVVSTQTDAQGQYQINGLVPRDNYKVEASAVGYRMGYYPLTIRWDMATPVQVLDGEITSDIDIPLKKLDASISGTLTYKDGNPAQGVWMSAFYDDWDFWFTGSYSDQNGDYVIPITAGNWIVSSRYTPPYITDRTRISAISGQTIDLDFQLYPAGIVTGSVVDERNGQPLANIAVGLMRIGEIMHGGTCTDNNGQYRIEGVSQGDYKAYAWSQPWCSLQNYQREYWAGEEIPGGTPNIDAAKVLTFSSGDPAITNINFTLLPVETPVEVGDDVSVSPSPGLTINFDQVGQEGVATSVQTSFDPDNLANFKLLGSAYDIATSAQFSSAQVCFNYDDSGLTSLQERLLSLYHQENLVWEDITDSNYPDTNTNLICGTVTSFSPFAILYSTKPVLQTIATPLDPRQVNTTVNATATFVDPDLNDTHTAVWDWGDGSTSDGVVNESNLSINGSHTYTKAGVYTVKVTLTDAAGASDDLSFNYVVIYNPSAGFVTGGGWINSPAGAYTADPSLTGKATFGFVSKYQKGAKVPTGNTEFQFKVANLTFKSTAYDWLVIAGEKAQYKGIGTVNGTGSYRFILTAIDGKITGGGGAVDKFRIKICDLATGNVMYDNQQGAADDALPSTAIQGGSIVIHK